MSGERSSLWLLCAASSFAVHLALVSPLYEMSRLRVSGEMEVAIPRFAQVVMAVGDRYLAADLAGFRALVASTEQMDEQNYRILAQVQSDVAWFNPAHEDNYYIATAILPWAGEIGAAQRILKAATMARPRDWQPAFYYAFNAFYFEKDLKEGAKWLHVAAEHAADDLDRIQLLQLAALWVGKADDLDFAIQMHYAMAKETKHRSFAQFLEKRAMRLENQLMLEKAIVAYFAKKGEKPARLENLVESDMLPSIPSDPFGARYTINELGNVELQQPEKNTQRNKQ